MTDELDGMLDEEGKSDDLGQLTPEQLAEKKTKTIEEIKALRQEKQRVKTLAETTQQEFSKKFREEQIGKAKQRFYSEFSDLDEQSKKAVDEEFVRTDSGKIDAENIYQDYVGAYAKLNAPSLIEAKKEKEKLEKNAAEYNAQMASSMGSGQPTEGKTYSQEAYDIVKKAVQEGLRLTLDEAERVVKQGLTRKFK